MNMDINIHNIPINKIQLKQNCTIDVLRLDAIHSQISGNKYFKLLFNIQEAIKQNKTQIVTLGGAYSNHLHAFAYLCNQQKLKSIGIIRGQKVYNPTLTDCENWGMELCFTDYKNWINLNYKQLLKNIEINFPNAYFIPMGGDNLLGVEGFSLLQKYFIGYDIIVCSVGTGTSLAGILKYTQAHQKIIGVQAVKDDNVKNNISFKSGKENFILIDDCTFGGFAKFDNTLINFIKMIRQQFNLPLDFVYTAKSLYALFNGNMDKYIALNSKILFVHTGGLQGNRGIEQLDL